MKIVIPILLIIAAGLFYYFSYYPPVVLENRTKEALQTFATNVKSKDRVAIGHALQQLLTEDAKIKLDVSFFSLGLSGKNPVVSQEFGKEQFITFIDNIIYPLTDYDFSSELETFVLADNKQSAEVTFTAQIWADGASMYGGISVDMRYSSDVKCEGKVNFTAQSTQLKTARCGLTLHTVPKPGQESKIQSSPDVMREFLLK